MKGTFRSVPLGPRPTENLISCATLAGRVLTISTFYGILIRMFFNDHPPPHFHARYGEFEATIDSERLALAEGELPQPLARTSFGLGQLMGPRGTDETALSQSR